MTIRQPKPATKEEKKRQVKPDGPTGPHAAITPQQAKAAPASLRTGDLLQMQKAVGNRAVSQFLSATIQMGRGKDYKNKKKNKKAIKSPQTPRDRLLQELPADAFVSPRFIEHHVGDSNDAISHAITMDNIKTLIDTNVTTLADEMRELNKKKMVPNAVVYTTRNSYQFATYDPLADHLETGAGPFHFTVLPGETYEVEGEDITIYQMHHFDSAIPSSTKDEYLGTEESYEEEASEEEQAYDEGDDQEGVSEYGAWGEDGEYN